MAYNYEFKGSYYFKKIINQKYLLNREIKFLYRRSFRLCVDQYYYSFLSKNKDSLDRLSKYINYNLVKRLKENPMDVTDINSYIQELCEIYRNEALIENSILEEKRIIDLQYIDKNGLQSGYLLQSISKKYKELDLQYSDFSDQNKTQKLGTEIVRHSDISTNDILKIPANKLIQFYEMLIKSERNILENDIKRYIQRNLFEFLPLFNYKSKTEDEKIDEAYYTYLSLIRNNKPSNNYLNLINSTSKIVQDEYQPQKTTQDILKSFIEDENETDVLNTKLSSWALIDKFIHQKGFTKQKANSYRNSLRFFCEYLDGDGKKYKKLEIEYLEEKHIIEFRNLITECPPKNKRISNLTLFELVKLRKETNISRMFENSIIVIENHIKVFWKYLCKNIIDMLDPTLMKKLELKYELSIKKDNEGIFDPILRGFFNYEIQKVIDQSFSEKKLKQILLNSPRSFYSFIFSAFLGLRIAEFTLIKTSDIKVQKHNGKNIYYIWLNEDDPIQKLKNTSAHRNIIISDLLIELGFLNYVNLRIKREKKWLWDFPKSKYAPIIQFWKREFQILFPKDILSITNRPYNYIQFKSLRKNFIEKNLSEDSKKYNTDQNKKRLQGHTSDKTASGIYLGRIEPYKGKYILDAFKDYELQLSELKKSVLLYYKKIKLDLPIQELHNGEWAIISRVKMKRSRKS